jgi:WD40 repeat protein/tRNA A-37 threonylcarbamoyl transferase component Bud32
MNEHPTADRLRKWLDGRLSQADSEAIETHLATCADVCAPILDKLSQGQMAPQPSEAATQLPVQPVDESPTLPWHGDVKVAAISVPGFEVFGELGRGGMSVVYKARQKNLNRLVALKVILSGKCAGVEDRERFQTDAEAIAQLQHPNIVQIHEIGEYDGQPFFSLEYCEGGSLESKLKATTLPAQAAADMLETLARAMQAAHDHNLVHRDLKPGNVLLTADGMPKITDFGLAKKLDQVGPTQTNEIMGAPSYMAPEQADAKFGAIGPAVDVYALGAILYECLTGRPPFKAATSLDTIFQVVSDDPLPPTQLQAKTPRDLETISLCCLRKDPKRRYGSAQALADDLGRWRKGEPIKARRVGWLERAGKWVKRRPTAAALITVIALALLSLGAGGVWHNGQLQASLEATRQRELTARRYHYAADMNLALQDFRQGHDTFVLARLNRHRPRPGEEDLRCFEWFYLWRLCHHGRTLRGHGGPVFAVVFSPTGANCATASGDGTVRLWDCATGKEIGVLRGHDGLVTAISFAPKARTLVSAGEDKTVCLWDCATLQLLDTSDNSAPLSCIAFDLEGNTVVAGGHDGFVRRWDVDQDRLHSRPEAQAVRAHSGAVRSIAIARDGRTLATGGEDGTIKLWKVEAGGLGLVRELKSHTDEVWSLAFSTDGRRLASAGTDDPAYVWDVASGAKVLTLKGSNRDFLSVAYSRDGATLATGGRSGLVSLWDAATGAQRGRLEGHAGPAYTVSFSPDVRVLATGAVDGTARLWDLESEGRGLGPRHGYDKLVLPGAGRLRAAAFRPDGRLVATADSELNADTAATLWDTGKGTEVARLAERTGPAKALAFSADGTILALGTDDGTIAAWDVRENDSVWQVRRRWAKRGDAPVLAVAVSADGGTVATGDSGQTIRLWDAATGVERMAWKAHKSEVAALAFNADGKLLASGGYDRAVKLWQVSDGKALSALRGEAHADWVTGLVFAPDGRTLASASDDCTIKLWDVSKSLNLSTLEGHAGWMGCLAFAPDSKTLVSGGDDLTVQLWDRSSGLVRASLDGPTRMPRAVAFSRDGKTLFTVGEDRLLLRWQAATDDEVRQQGD